MYNQNEQIVFLKLFEGKSDEEIIRICEKYLGPWSNGHFQMSLSNSLDIDNLGRVIKEIREGSFYKAVDLSDEDKRRVQREHGIVGGQRDNLGTLALIALNTEANEIIKTGLVFGFNDAIPSYEEIKRRVILLNECCPKNILQGYVKASLSKIWYVDSMEKIENKFAGRDIISYLGIDLPPFLNLVEALKQIGVNLNELEMENGYTVVEVYDLVQERFGKYLHNGQVINPGETFIDEKSSREEYDSAKKVFERTKISTSTITDVQDKHFDDLEEQKKAILASKHFTDEQKAQMIEELYKDNSGISR